MKKLLLLSLLCLSQSTQTRDLPDTDTNTECTNTSALSKLNNANRKEGTIHLATFGMLLTALVLQHGRLNWEQGVPVMFCCMMAFEAYQKKRDRDVNKEITE